MFALKMLTTKKSMENYLEPWICVYTDFLKKCVCVCVP